MLSATVILCCLLSLSLHASHVSVKAGKGMWQPVDTDSTQQMLELIREVQKTNRSAFLMQLGMKRVDLLYFQTQASGAGIRYKYVLRIGSDTFACMQIEMSTDQKYSLLESFETSSVEEAAKKCEFIVEKK